MVAGINAIQNFFTKPVTEREGSSRIGGGNFFRAPGVQPASTSNPFGISIPQNHSYTTDVDGTRVAMGQDGVGLAHRNQDEYRLHLIA